MTPYYERDGITLYHADCRELLATMQAGSVRVLVSDPPYGIGWKRGVNHVRNSKAHSGIANDNDTSARDEALRLLPGVSAIVFGSFYAPFSERVKQVLVWQKPPDSGLVGSVTGFRRDAEPIFLVGDWPQKTVERSSVLVTLRGQSSIVSETGHPHTKPVELMEILIDMCPPGGAIIDPFAGSCTTGVAAWNLGRKAVLCEISEEYCELGAKRLDRVISQGRLFKPEPVRETQATLFEEQQ